MARTKTRPENPDEEFFRTKITTNLRRYPNITISMLSSHVRPYGKEWRQALENMIKEGLVERKVEVEDVSRAITTYKLAEFNLPITS